MTLGEKIKKIRLEKKMTQAEVCGDYITRNMLSRIENNSATPSLSTIEYIANRLTVPTAHFFDAKKSAAFSRKETDEIFEKIMTVAEKKELFAEYVSMAENTVSIRQFLYAYLLFNNADNLEEFLDDSQRLHLKGKSLIKNGQVEEGIAVLEKIEAENVVMAQVYKDIENACIGINDYKKAYIYANKAKKGE